MNFTVVFKSNESQIFTYGLVFIPTVCWIDDNSNDNILFNSQCVEYKLGYVSELMKTVNKREKGRAGFGYFENLNEDVRNCIIVVNDISHGSVKDLELLIEDLHNEGFTPNVMHLQTTFN